MRKVVGRYPFAIRSGAVIVCLVLALAISRKKTGLGPIVVEVGFACLTIAIVAYKNEVDAAEVRIRYLPFYTKRTPLHEVRRIVEDKTTLVLVTAKTEIPLWGLSANARGPLFDILPRHLEVTSKRRSTRTDSAIVVRRQLRRTIIVAVVFGATLGLSVPFLKGNPWNQYVDRIGKYVLFFCFCMFLLLLFQAGFAYVLWSNKRAFDKIEGEEHAHRNR